ncbi:MAG: Hpt domain-containing protein [Proteobacteria bacterium]|nr:Hpt domain-containing protein [Pseudomonadota bacterium]
MSAEPDSKPPSAEKAGSNPVFDNIVRAVGQERAGRLFGDFTVDTKERMERIGDATASGDVATLQKEAHELRGTAGHFGFQDLSDLAGEIETACRNGDAAQARDLARRVQRAGEAALETAAAYGCPGGEDADGTVAASRI